MSELRKDSLSFIETLGQSVANVSPTLTPALSIAVIAGTAGAGSWLVYVLATIAMLVVGVNVGKLSRRIPAAGSFFLYVSRTLGPSWGMLSGWSMLAAYLMTAMALTVATSIFFKTMLTGLGVTWTPPTVLLYGVVSLLAWFLSSRDIRISSRVGLSLEAVSVTIITLVCLMVLFKSGFKADMKQITLAGLAPSAVPQAIVFGIFSFVGFESAATLAKETRDPETTIPRAINWTAVSAGLFFVFTTYVIMIGFGDQSAKLAASSSPLADLLKSESPLLIAVVYFGAAISSFACALASLNAFGRLLFSLGRYQFVHQSMGMIHAEHKTPHIALALGAAVNFVLCVAFIKAGAETDTFGWYGTLASFGFILVYLMCSVCAPLYLQKIGEVSGKDYALGALGVVLMVGAVVGSLYPMPAYPLNLLPYIFLAYLFVGVVWFLVLKARAPQTLLGIEHDMEVAGEA
ncbi:APC family permease [Rhodoblastus acidophilus]|uniref:APC family permease n=1 Tax=Candidatus Rhodoblastus alkanivorans TaxID=2954117 RepID=A0ABS9Z514_9HYPH|nr:APC family permease [Candidatus Rhodoblastus alkanivorans]MCI4679018.1 APC family permease [Candidatus Rhodoblastus alkanivorans]MCI4681727.1 APC family permease [Candidatus Rhodoblastus alkanivorans]MDI4642776.1 APC family permease [Rhodoblastus acidophilus]